MGEAWSIDRFGLDALQRAEVASAPLGPGQVRLAVRAVALNYRDLLMVRGTYDPRVPLPLVPCSDGVGVVVERADDVALPLGARVLPLFAQGWLGGPPQAAHLRTTLGGPLPGMLQAERVVDARAVVPAPPHLDDLEAATLPCAAVTAWHALEAAGVGPGHTVLTLGTGGVSLFALLLAKARGARVAITSSSDARLQAAVGMGADLALNYRRQPDWGREVAGWAGDGVDAVIEVGGAGTMAQSLRATRVGGTIALIGVLAGATGEVPLVHALMRSIRIQGIFVGHAGHARDVVAAMRDHGLRPPIASVYAWEQAPDAFAALAAGGQLGKVVVRGPA